jgi:hypothetical protein
MKKFLLKFFKKPVRKIAFIDGDQPMGETLYAYERFIADEGYETHFVRLRPSGHSEPKVLRKYDGVKDFNKIYIPQGQHFVSKEVVDKFIGAYIQKSISDGYDEIAVISSDYDFVDIFKMAAMIDESATNLTFRLIVPSPSARHAGLPFKINNIEIVKVKNAQTGNNPQD